VTKTKTFINFQNIYYFTMTNYFLSKIHEGKNNREYSLVDHSDSFRILVDPLKVIVEANGERLGQEEIQGILQPELEEIVESGSENSELATEILDVMKDPSSIVQSEQSKNEPYVKMTDEVRQALRNAFSAWEGRPDARQRDFLKDFGLGYEHTNGYSKIYRLDRPNVSIRVSSTPTSAGGAGGGVHRDIRDYIFNSPK
jgi:hypothetical protein